MPAGPQLTWWSALDILILAVVVYEALLLVRGTRAAQMLAGLGVVALAMWLARFGDLPATNWLTSRLAPYAFIVLIVLFQAEIRHVLVKIGRVLTLGPATLASEAYEDIVMAASYFAQQRTGALIVLERETGLRTYIESGVPMDARISYDLLATIFRPTAPLHDGAVIVQGDRIAAAACFLPLSMNPVLSNQLGTRHRAAIGITEETDAVAIVISEETGQIALAQGGKIERDVTAEDLRQRLSSALDRYVAASTPPTPVIDEPDAESALSRKPEVLD